jgi:hypothetical protein
MDLGDLGFDLCRAFQRARCGNRLARHRRQAAEAELVALMPIAAHRLAWRHRVRPGGARQPVDGADQRGRRQVEHAFA